MIEPAEFTRLSLEPDGTELLKERLEASLMAKGLADDIRLVKCISLALGMHGKDRRTYEPYNNHLLRVILTITESFDIDDVNVLAAAILHDIIEDHSFDLARHHGPEADLGEIQQLDATPLEERMTPSAIKRKRLLGARALALYVGSEEVMSYVLAVSNPIVNDPTVKNESYRDHIQRLVETGPPESVLIKLADFIDNAFAPPGNREDSAKRSKLDSKQAPIYDIFIGHLPLLRELLGDDNKINLIGRLLEEGKRLSQERLEGRSH